MTTTNPTTTTMTKIPYAKLRLSDANVRKRNGTLRIASLTTSILAHGLLQPLIVSPAKGKKTLFDVHAGGRRWRAIGAAIEAGDLPKDYEVDVKLCADEALAAREISLAENLQREAMTPADECQAYRAIIHGGASEEDVANRFGVTVRHVQGRLRLADLAEPIFAALAEGKITLDAAMAYGSTPDHERQLAVWQTYGNSWRANDATAIRREIASTGLAANHPIALFVGETEYTGAGGRIERDLFASEGEGLWLDAELAQELAEKKLIFEAEVAALGSKLGWVKPVLGTHVPYEETQALGGYWPKRADPSPEAMARIEEIGVEVDNFEEEQAKLLNEYEEIAEGNEEAYEKLQEQIETLDKERDSLFETNHVIPDEDRPAVGTFLFIGKDGQSVLASNYYTTAKSKRGGINTGNGRTGGTQDSTTGATDALPRTLIEQMAKDRRDVLALHVAMDPALALDLAIFSLARDLAGRFKSTDIGCTIKIGELFEPGGLKNIPQSSAQIELASLHDGLPADWAQEPDAFEAFLAFRALDEEVRANWLAFAVANSLKASLATGQYRNAFQTRLGALIGIDTAQHWRPGAERYFDKVKKSAILSVLGTIDPTMPGRFATAKKSELASMAAKLCAGETIVEPEVKARALAWLPEDMVFTTGEPIKVGDADEVGGDTDPISHDNDDEADAGAEGVVDREDGADHGDLAEAA